MCTKDGVLVARHGLTLDDSTDVASRPEFAARCRTQVRPVHLGSKSECELRCSEVVAPLCTFRGRFDLTSTDSKQHSERLESLFRAVPGLRVKVGAIIVDALPAHP